MDPTIAVILTSSVVGVTVSSLFSFVQFLITRKDESKKVKNTSCIEMQARHEEYFKDVDDRVEKITNLCLGLAYDRIIHVGSGYLNRGWITVDEREDFRKYLWQPYHDAGGNGSGDAMMKAIDSLPVRKESKHE